MTDIGDAVRTWARGIYPTEAGAELLIRHGRTIHERAPWLVEFAPDTDGLGRIVGIDTARLLDASGVLSGGERRVVEIAASLIDGHPVDLSDVMCGLDERSSELVLAALAHAAGLDGRR
jgi:hypothetical protein